MPSLVTKRPAKARGWWGDGPSPTVTWPGVTIDLPAVWKPKRHRWESPDGRYWFDKTEADRACAFFSQYLRHHMGEFAGQPFDLLPYQRLLVVVPFCGWKSTVTDLRRFRKVFAFIPKGGGKSPLGAGLGLFFTFCDREPGAEGYAVAADKKQARTVHDNARIMVETMTAVEPEFGDMFTVYRDSIECADTHSTYQVISADASTKHGFRPHVVIFDEFHAQKNRDLYEVLKRSMVKRRQPVMFIITHAGDDDEGICYEEYEYAKGVLEGRIQDDTCLPVIFEAKTSDDWTDPDLWAKVNPGHGITVKHDAIEQECREAQIEPRKLNDFMRFHLNRWTNQATAWIPIEWWDACQGPMTEADLVGLECAGGLDLAQKWDLACFAVVFKKPIAVQTDVEVVSVETTGAVTKKPVSLNYELWVRPYFWIPENTMRQHEKQDGVPYTLWSEQGLVTPTEGDVIDYAKIYQDITTKIVPAYPKLKEGLIGYDPAFATDLATKLRDLSGLKIAEVLQNYTHISEPAQIVEALIKGKRVRQDGHRLMRWNWSNVSIKQDDAGRIRPVKPRNASKRIDGAVAMLIAQAALSLQAPQPSFQMFFFGGKK